MIFYKKNLNRHHQKQKEYTFSVFEDGLAVEKDDSVAQPTQCHNAYNISFEDGSLSTGLGVRFLQVPADVSHLNNLHTFDMNDIGAVLNVLVDKWYNSETAQYYYQIFIVDFNKKIRALPAIDPYNGRTWIQSERLTEAPSHCCVYREEDVDSTLFFANSGVVALSYGQEHVYANVPEMLSCVVHYGTFFGITKADRNKLIYTNKLKLSTWTENEGLSVIEFLDNRGAFTKLVTFNDYVYLFRENGITKISKYSLNGDFAFTHLYYSPSKIYENSICVCGDKIFFVTRDGIYTFDGNKVAKVLRNYDKYFKHLKNDYCSSCCLNGKYYLATNCDFQDGQVVGWEDRFYYNNVLFEIDVFNKDVKVLRGVDIKQLAVIDSPYYSKVICSFNSTCTNQLGEIINDGKIINVATPKSWTSFCTDFGYYNKRKKIKEIVLKSKYDCQIKIISDEESKTFSISGRENMQRMQVNVCGKEFKVEFLSSNSDIKICKPKFVFDVVV